MIVNRRRHPFFFINNFTWDESMPRGKWTRDFNLRNWVNYERTENFPVKISRIIFHTLLSAVTWRIKMNFSPLKTFNFYDEKKATNKPTRVWECVNWLLGNLPKGLTQSSSSIQQTAVVNFFLGGEKWELKYFFFRLSDNVISHTIEWNWSRPINNYYINKFQHFIDVIRCRLFIKNHTKQSAPSTYWQQVVELSVSCQLSFGRHLQDRNLKHFSWKSKVK